MRFASRVREAREWDVPRQVSEGRRLLKARAAENRALGGILLFLNGELDWESSAAVAKDDKLIVPLAVFDWIRDFGTEEEAAAFSSALQARDIPDDELVAWLETSASMFAGGRSALDLLLGRHDEETVATALEPVILAPGVAYDVREEALFKLLEPENKVAGLNLLGKLAENETDTGSILFQSLTKWTSFAHLSDAEDEEVPYKVWDTPIRGLTHLAESDMGLAVRSLANYLEYGLHRDNPAFEPVVEEGSYQIAKAFLDRARTESGSLCPEEADALDRLETCVERLVSYDPAFVTEENESAEDADEEIDVEILDAEDAYLAALLAADNDDEDGVESDEEEDDGEEDEDEADASKEDDGEEDVGKADDGKADEDNSEDQDNGEELEDDGDETQPDAVI